MRYLALAADYDGVTVNVGVASRVALAEIQRLRLSKVNFMNSGILHPGTGQSVWVVGDHYTIKASGDDTGGAFTLIEVVVPAGSGPPPHVHSREDEAFYVLEGEFEVHIDDQRFTAGPGTWVTLANGSLHHFKNIGRAIAKMLIVATPAGLDKYFLEAGRVANDVSPESGAATSKDIEKLLAVSPKYGIEIKLPKT